MTILVYYKRKVYTDSRTSNRNGVVSDSSCKISKPLPNTTPMWGKDEVLSTLFAGLVPSIDIISGIILNEGLEGIKKFNSVSKHFQNKVSLRAIGYVVTTNNIYEVRGNGYKITHKKLDINDIHILGSGANSALFAAKVIKTDGIGAVCMAIAEDNNCGGYVLSHDPWDKRSVVVSKHYRYPRLRTIYGIFLRQYEKLRDRYLFSIK